MIGAERLLLITSGSSEQRAALRAVLAVLPRAGALVQLRAPDLPGGALLERARALVAICATAGAPLLVNDRVDVARAAGAAGVHLPARGLPPEAARKLLGAAALIGVSTHAASEVAAAARAGADYVVFGPVFEVPGKGPAQGVAALGAAVRSAPLPVFALGGVGIANAAACITAGARGVACIRAVFAAADPAAAAVLLWQAVTA